MIKKIHNEIIIPESGILEHDVSFVLCNKDNYKKWFETIKTFNSGNDILDEFIVEAHKHDECITYLFLRNDKLVAFCSMSCSAIFIDELYDKQKEPISIMHPAIEFRYFAVRKEYHTKKFECTDTSISSYIFNQCLLYAYHISQKGMAAEYFVLHAKNEYKVRKFYKKHNFNEFTSNMRNITDITFSDCIPAFLKIPSKDKIYGQLNGDD